MRGHGRLTTSDLEIMRRSLACNGLPDDQVSWLLGEARRLLDEQARVRQIVGLLVSPMADVRAGLNELHTILHG